MKMVEPDLDSFFEEVSEAEAQVSTEDFTKDNEDSQIEATNGEEIFLPPTKKAKVESTTSGSTGAGAEKHRPVGIVVASSTSIMRKNEADTINDYQNYDYGKSVTTIQPLFPPPPPPPEAAFPIQYSMTSIAQKPTVMTSIATSTTTSVPPPPPAAGQDSLNHHNKVHKRKAAGKVWVDPTMSDWPDNDFRIFVGNLSRDITDQQLFDHFAKYPSLAKVRVVRDAKGTSKGFGFCSFLQPIDYAKALREMDQTWLSSRPIRIKRSDWKDQELNNVKKKEKKMFKMQHR